MSKREVYIIEPPKGFIRVNFREIWQYKELLFILIWRNIKVRYKQTIVGAAWVILQPIFTMIIFTIFLGIIAKLPSDNVPYPIFIFTGLIYWNFFAAALTGASNSLIESQNIIKKIYFPRLIIPLAATITPAIDFLLVFLILLGLMAYFHQKLFFGGILMMPVLIVIAFLAATGIGLIMASINAKYRDIQFALGFLTQVLFYVTPIIYPISLVPEKYRWLAYFNPMAGIINVGRNSLLGNQPIDFLALSVSFGISLVLLIIGIIYFGKSEQTVADIL